MPAGERSTRWDVPKASFYALRRVFAPRTVVISDEGLSGLWLHIFNDGPDRFNGSVRLRVFNDPGSEIEAAEGDVELAAHGAVTLRADELLGGFRDLNNAYRLTPLTYDVTAAELLGRDGRVLARACHLAAGPARRRLGDVGLAAHAELDSAGKWWLHVSSTLFAHYVAVDIPWLQAVGLLVSRTAAGHGDCGAAR